ncbi:MAG: aliphatic sulfonate ABC transporter substrate-binding protein [Chloroflexi bacterium]|nr:aliphatic sulfonate ABC transporter substrate-binding protein [Chloroflexota bacterium]
MSNHLIPSFFSHFSHFSHFSNFSHFSPTRRALLAGAAFGIVLAACGGAAATSKPAEVRLDYATYNLSSLVLHKNGWLEEELGKDGVKVTWNFSAGSNKANELVNSGSSDFGSTAGAAALLARTNGVPQKTVYIFSKPEWTALVVRGDSTIASVTDLKGKKIAVTRGTDPFFFLLRSLKEAGLSQSDVEIVNLQHADGRAALIRGDVDAWSGLDPHMASAQLTDGAKLLYRNINFNTFGVLNVREDFAQKYPEYVKKVIIAYERARKWILENPDQAAQILAEAGKIDPAVATLQISERTVLDKDTGAPNDALKAALQAVVPILKDEKLVAAEKDPEKALTELIDASLATAAIK